MKKKILFSLIACALSSFTRAQNVVNVTSINGLTSSITLGDQYNFSVELTYTSGNSTTFSPEYLRLKFLTDKMVELDEDPGYIGPPINNLVLNQGVPQLIDISNFPFDSSNFRQGGNIVVIWPSYIGGVSADSLEIALEGILPDSANGLEKLDGINLQTVWLNDKINWSALEKYGVSEGIVLNGEGRLLHSLNKEESFTSKQIESGIHYFVFTSEKGKFLVFKEFSR